MPGSTPLADPTPAAKTNNHRAGLTIAEKSLPFCIENFLISLIESPIKAVKK